MVWGWGAAFACGSVAAAAACNDVSNDDTGATPSIALYAFPETVSPGGESALIAQVQGTCSAGTCTLCVGVPPASVGGSLYVPGETASSSTVLTLASVPADQAIHFAYQAPAASGSEVVTALLYDSPTTCAEPVPDGGGGVYLGHLIGSASVRITIGTPQADASSDGAGVSDALADGSADLLTPADAANDAPIDGSGETATPDGALREGGIE